MAPNRANVAATNGATKAKKYENNMNSFGTSTP
jgi:hypothetical protein